MRFYQTASHLLTPFFQSERRLYPWLRDVGFGGMGRLPTIRRHMLETLAGVKIGPLAHLDPGEWHPDYALRK